MIPAIREKMVWCVSPEQEFGISSSSVIYIMMPAVAAIIIPIDRGVTALNR